MKRILSFLLVVLLLIGLSACGDTPYKSDDEPPTNTNSNNSAEKMYADFLSGKITAVYADKDVYIDYWKETATPHTLTYALLDRNGDSIPELCINNQSYVVTFWVANGTLTLWCEEHPYAKILRNGNCLEIHHGGAPNHTDYSYQIYSYTGDTVCSVSISVLLKNDVDVLENIYTQVVSIRSGSAQEASKTTVISKEQFDITLNAIEKIGEAEILWKPVE